MKIDKGGERRTRRRNGRKIKKNRNSLIRTIKLKMEREGIKRGKREEGKEDGETG